MGRRRAVEVVGMLKRDINLSRTICRFHCGIPGRQLEAILSLVVAPLPVVLLVPSEMNPYSSDRRGETETEQKTRQLTLSSSFCS